MTTPPALPNRSPRRSLLMTPADDERLIQKAFRSGADAVWLDLEDGVALDRKDSARAHLPEQIRRHRGDFRGELLVRVNPLDADGLADIDAVRSADIDGIVLTKIQEADDVLRAEARLQTLQDARTGATPSLWVMIETPRSVLEVARIAAAGRSLTALIFGGGDLVRALGSHARPGDWDEALGYARARTILAARAHGLSVIDSTHAIAGDEAGTEQAAARSFRLGFDGKLAATPRQIPPIHRAWAPSAAEREAAERAVAPGHALSGHVMPAAALADARRVLARANVPFDITTAKVPS